MFRFNKDKKDSNNIFPPDFPLDSEPFETHYKKMMEMDQSLDFYILRMTFTETEEYDPYDSKLKELKKELYNAVREEDFNKILKWTTRVLQRFCLDFDAHFLNYQVYTELKDDENSKFYSFTFNGLAKSLFDHGDAKKIKTAIPVINIDEEYFLLDQMHIQVKEQKLIEHKNRYYDFISGMDPKAHQLRDFYFDVTIPYIINSNRMLKNIVEKSIN